MENPTLESPAGTSNMNFGGLYNNSIFTQTSGVAFSSGGTLSRQVSEEVPCFPHPEVVPNTHDIMSHDMMQQDDGGMYAPHQPLQQVIDGGNSQSYLSMSRVVVSDVGAGNKRPRHGSFDGSSPATALVAPKAEAAHAYSSLGAFSDEGSTALESLCADGQGGASPPACLDEGGEGVGKVPKLLKVPEVIDTLAAEGRVLTYDISHGVYVVQDGRKFEEAFNKLRRVRSKKNEAAKDRPFSRMHTHFTLVQGERWGGTGTVFRSKQQMPPSRSGSASSLSQGARPFGTAQGAPISREASRASPARDDLSSDASQAPTPPPPLPCGMRVATTCLHAGGVPADKHSRPTMLRSR